MSRPRVDAAPSSFESLGPLSSRYSDRVAPDMVPGSPPASQPWHDMSSSMAFRSSALGETDPYLSGILPSAGNRSEWTDSALMPPPMEPGASSERAKKYLSDGGGYVSADTLAWDGTAATAFSSRTRAGSPNFEVSGMSRYSSLSEPVGTSLLNKSALDASFSRPSGGGSSLYGSALETSGVSNSLGGRFASGLTDEMLPSASGQAWADARAILPEASRHQGFDQVSPHRVTDTESDDLTRRLSSQAYGTSWEMAFGTEANDHSAYQPKDSPGRSSARYTETQTDRSSQRYDTRDELYMRYSGMVTDHPSRYTDSQRDRSPRQAAMQRDRSPRHVEGQRDSRNDEAQRDPRYAEAQRDQRYAEVPREAQRETSYAEASRDARYMEGSQRDARYMEGSQRDARYTEGAAQKDARYTGAAQKDARYTEGAAQKDARYTEGAAHKDARYTEGAGQRGMRYVEGAQRDVRNVEGVQRDARNAEGARRDARYGDGAHHDSHGTGVQRDSHYTETQRDSRYAEGVQRNSRYLEGPQRDSRYSEGAQRDSRYGDATQRDSRHAEGAQRESRTVEPHRAVETQRESRTVDAHRDVRMAETQRSLRALEVQRESRTVEAHRNLPHRESRTAEAHRDPRHAEGHRDPSPRYPETAQRDRSPRCAEALRDRSREVQRERSPRYAAAQRDRSPRRADAMRDRSPRIADLHRDRSPQRYSETQRDRSPRYGEKQAERSARHADSLRYADTPFDRSSARPSERVSSSRYTELQSAERSSRYPEKQRGVDPTRASMPEEDNRESQRYRHGRGLSPEAKEAGAGRRTTDVELYQGKSYDSSIAAAYKSASSSRDYGDRRPGGSSPMKSRKLEPRDGSPRHGGNSSARSYMMEDRRYRDDRDSLSRAFPASAGSSGQHIRDGEGISQRPSPDILRDELHDRRRAGEERYGVEDVRARKGRWPGDGARGAGQEKVNGAKDLRNDRGILSMLPDERAMQLQGGLPFQPGMPVDHRLLMPHPMNFSSGAGLSQGLGFPPGPQFPPGLPGGPFQPGVGMQQSLMMQPGMPVIPPYMMGQYPGPGGLPMGPNMGPPNMGPPNMGPPNMGPPNMGPPNMGGPHMGPPNMGPPNMGGPNMGMGGPNMGGPGMGPNMGPPQTNMPGAGKLKHKGRKKDGDGHDRMIVRRLDTNGWYDKRFVMARQWGFWLATDRWGSNWKFMLKWYMEDVVIHDASYYSVIQLTGPQSSILDVLAKITDPRFPPCIREEALLSESFSANPDGMTEKASIFLKGGLEGDMMIHSPGAYPWGAIAPARFSWRPIREVPREGAGAGSKLKVGAGPQFRRQFWLWVHAAAFDEALQGVQAACDVQNSAWKSRNENGRYVTCFGRKAEYGRLELKGAGARDLLRRVVRPLEWLPGGNRADLPPDGDGSTLAVPEQETPTMSVIDRWIRMLPSCGMLGLRAQDPRNSRSKPAGKDELSARAHRRERKLMALNYLDQSMVGEGAGDVSNERKRKRDKECDDVDGGRSLGELADDGRNQVSSDGKALPTAYNDDDGDNCSIEDDPVFDVKDDWWEPFDSYTGVVGLCDSMELWNPNRDWWGKILGERPRPELFLNDWQMSEQQEVELAKQKAKEEGVIQVDMASISHDTTMDVERDDKGNGLGDLGRGQAGNNKGDRMWAESVPIILVNRGGHESHSRWSIIMPWKWAGPFWMALTSNGGSGVGVNEWRRIVTETRRPAFPWDFPDTKAFLRQTWNEYTVKKERFEKQQSAQPTTTCSIPIPLRFSPIVESAGSILQDDTLEAATEKKDFCYFVARSLDVLRNAFGRRMPRRGGNMAQERLPKEDGSDCLVSVWLNLIRDVPGYVEDGAEVCVANVGDFDNYCSSDMWNGVSTDFALNRFTGRTVILKIREVIGYVTTTKPRGIFGGDSVLSAVCRSDALKSLREWQHDSLGESRMMKARSKQFSDILVFIRNKDSIKYRPARVKQCMFLDINSNVMVL